MNDISTLDGWRNHCEELERSVTDLEFKVMELESQINTLQIERDLLMEVITTTSMAISKR